MTVTPIEWTDHSVNPIRMRSPNGKSGHYCEKASAGCRNCYSSRMQPRFGLPQFQDRRGETEGIYLDPSKLEEVLRRKKPTKFFWCDMTDMFGPWVPFEWIAACFGVMAATPHHIHQVLTKHPKRALEFFEWHREMTEFDGEPWIPLMREAVSWLPDKAGERLTEDGIARHGVPELELWPLPNVWLGTSTENQEQADKRIDVLRQIPAAVRFLSIEPLLGPIELPDDFNCDSQSIHMCASVEGMLRGRHFGHMLGDDRQPLSRSEAKRNLEELQRAGIKVVRVGSCDNFDDQKGCLGHNHRGKISWVIIGGESGPGARPCNVEWIRSIVRDCKDAVVPVFVKQLGAFPVDGTATGQLRSVKHKKGAEMSEWPEDLQVREFPQ